MMDRLRKEILRLCRRYEVCSREWERREEAGEVREELKRLWGEVEGRLDLSDPGLLLALMDAYEVTREEGMLQEVLDVVGEGIDRLEVSAESVQLLAYCYYYAEEEECLVRARSMLEELKRRGETADKLAEAEKVLEEVKEF